jgi:hypothetical protein
MGFLCEIADQVDFAVSIAGGTALDRFGIYSDPKSLKVGHLFAWDAAAEFKIR